MSQRRPLEVRCGDSTCTKAVAPSHRRHAFSSPSLALPGMGGDCIACGESGLIDWERVHERDPADFEHTVLQLRKELIRDNYWGEPLPERIIRNGLRRGETGLEESALANLRSALRVNHFREGAQTLFAYNPNAHIIHCAQHATGTCCRTCLEKWFGIPRHLELGRSELQFLRSLVKFYAEIRLAEPQNVISEAA